MGHPLLQARADPPTVSSPFITKCDTAGEVSFAGTSMLTDLVFRLVPNVNHAYFRLRQQYQMWPRAIKRPNPWRRFADTPLVGPPGVSAGKFTVSRIS